MTSRTFHTRSRPSSPVASFVTKRLKHSVQVFDAIVDHEGRLAWCEALTIGSTNGPHGRSLCRIARCIGPGERGAFPFLDVNAEMLLRGRQVPLWRFRGFEKKYRRRYFGNQLYVAYFSEAMTRR